MVHKVHTILRAFDPLYIEYRKSRYAQLKVPLRPYLRKRHSPKTKYIRRKRQCCLFQIGLIYLIVGIAIISYFVGYINTATKFCNNPGKNVLNNHPELYYWDSCDYQVFDLNTEINADSCECRWLKLSVYS